MENKPLHHRNKHLSRYDFKSLAECTPELKKFIKKNKFNGEETIDFSHPEAVKFLNKALLKKDYQINHWDIPPNYLCPPIPGRADYIHYVADLISKTTPKSEKTRVLDIGVGANCIYPLVGHREYGWSFVGSEVDQIAFLSAQQNVQKNDLAGVIEIRKQVDKNFIFHGVINKDDHFDFTICNPPFHGSREEAELGSRKKNKNLGNSNRLNFGGKNHELWYEGGELAFIRKMIIESQDFKDQCRWFSSLVSAKENLSSLYGELKRVKVAEVLTVDMAQGNKVSRFVAWRF